MLVLSRKDGEAICIGQSIEIRIIRIRGRSVRLGITCPNEVPVYREEVIERLLAGSGDPVSRLNARVSAK